MAANCLGEVNDDVSKVSHSVIARLALCGACAIMLTIASVVAVTARPCLTENTMVRK